jgi:hypothetical protein
MTANDHPYGNWEYEILHKLDESAKNYNFPMLNNAYLYYARIRLSAYRSNSEWLIIFQELAFSEMHGLINANSAYGNKIDVPTMDALTIASTVSGKPIIDDQGNCLIDKYGFELNVRGKVIKMSPSEEDYQRAGISTQSSEPDCILILRLLAFLRPEDFFMSDKELLDIWGRNNVGLEKFLQLEDWHHPNIAGDELPSQSQCFQSLARAIARDDRNLYYCPQEVFNTHWTNWKRIE